MLREMGTFGAVMTVILLVLIAIKSILHYLNPKGENNDQTKRYRKHRRFVFGFLSIATLILGAYIITSIKNPELFQKINESTTPGFIYGSRLLVKLNSSRNVNYSNCTDNVSWHGILWGKDYLVRGI